MSKVILVANKKNNVDLVVSPIKTKTPLTETDIHELIENSEYSNLYVDNSNIKNAIAELTTVLKPLQENQLGREIKYQILERHDATITIHIETNNMSASAEISTALGGKHFSAKAILNTAQKAGVIRGFNKEQLIKLSKQAAKEPAGSIVKSEIAYGKLPIDGKDSKIEMLIESSQERILKPKEREDGSVDMRDLGDIMCVQAGEPLAKKIPFTPGIKGYTVTGEDLEPTPGEDVKIAIGEGTTLSAKNDSILVSSSSGLPRIIKNGVTVDNVYQVKNVDISTGHIRFEGSVIIDGDVCESMKVTATGDIYVGGFAESSTLEAGGDITVGTGIIGKKQDVDDLDMSKISMNSNIKAAGKVFAKYSQYTEINCDLLHIENQMMHNKVNVSKTLWIGTKDKANGKLIGGYIEAGDSVNAGTIGAPAGSPTIISFQEKINNYSMQITKLEETIAFENDKTSELKSAIEKLKLLPKNNANKAMLAKVVSTYQHHAKKMGEFVINKRSLDEDFKKYINNIHVEATEKFFHGVQVTIGEHKERTKREYGPSRIKYKNREVIIDPITST